MTVSIATFTKKGHVADKCDDYTITPTQGVDGGAGWADGFAESLIKGEWMSRLYDSCAGSLPTNPVLATCTVHISAHVDQGDSGVELGTYEIDLVRRYYNPSTIKNRDAHATDCPDMKGEWQLAADRNLDVALHLVKTAVLTVDGKRSATDLEDNVALFMKAPDLRPAAGWQVNSEGGSKYLVSYSFIDGKLGEKAATWEADVATKSVRYLNAEAKTFSWTPPAE